MVVMLIAKQKKMKKKEMKKFVMAWNAVNDQQLLLRRKELSELCVSDSIRMFNGLFLQALKEAPIRLTSGLIEQQALFHKKRP